MARTGIGIIGCGNISDAYITGAKRSPHLSIEGVADIDPERAAAQAERHGVRSRATDDLLADPRIDIVVNLTVPQAHGEVSRQILAAGKHVYSEKPLAATFAEGKSILQLATAAGRRIGCAPDTFFGAAHQTARRAIDEGRIGRVVAGAAAFLIEGMEHWHPNPEFFFKPGGGPVLDIGPYYVTQLVNLLGPVRSVVAIGSRGRDQRIISSEPRKGQIIDVAVDTTVNAVLEFAAGANVSFATSWDVISHDRRPIELYGDRGSLVAPDPNWFGGQVLTSRQPGEWEPIDSPAFAFAEPNRQLLPGWVVADYRGVGLIDLALALQANRPHRANGEQALHVLEVLEGIDLAASSGRRVDMATTCPRPDPLAPGTGEEVFQIP